jgi:hypothetical protein
MEYYCQTTFTRSLEIKKRDSTRDLVNTDVMTGYICCASATTAFAYRRTACLDSWLSKICSHSPLNHTITDTNKHANPEKANRITPAVSFTTTTFLWSRTSYQEERRQNKKNRPRFPTESITK